MYFGPSFWWGPSPFDFLFYNPYQPYGPNRYRNPSELSFLESVFSFLFGDGDPNTDLDERRYQQIAQVNFAYTVNDFMLLCQAGMVADAVTLCR